MTTTEARGGLDKALLSSLAKAVRGRVAAYVVVIVAAFVGGGMAVALVGGAVVTVAVAVVLGFVMSGFINAAHDCVHSSHLRSKRANRIMGAAWCTPLLLNFTNYRYDHLVHHRFTGVPGDTERPKQFHTLRSYLYSLSAIAYWRYNARTIARTWRNEFPASVNKDDRRRDSRADNVAICAWLVLAVVLTWFAPHVLLAVYWLPLLISAVVMRITGLPEHYGLWGVPEIERNTRTVRSNALFRLVLWNGNYHAEHHRYPAVATLNLHRLHKAMPEPHPIQSDSYLGFHIGLVKSLNVTRRAPAEPDQS
ncbi:Fatty acid desaturase [Actinokineospora alba]|uniref:Fatty acid desaturase n=1 Tax=Actinokineospora alba TaxID=504798 RepID=A0A1H0JXN9_9PSEU|nr:fatty acid desaturase [Actinokineospora alba]TDP68127.1 fatty acid desaturase [Actinokineospora alba]SDH92820.1 Fatty acid desaturase [Actinokineospora alba]SDO48273.1 Fatty acid desaturase [Actinokineospora alba]